MTPQAVSPVFPATLADDGGTLTGDLTTIGVDEHDSVATGPGADGRAMSAFLAADRAASLDSTLTNLVGDQPFATVAPVADVPSHDAVITVATAAARAHSAQPADVLTALAGLQLSHADGLAGPALDLSDSSTLPVAAVTALRASTDDPGLRPGSASLTLSWFKLPAA